MACAIGKSTFIQKCASLTTINRVIFNEGEVAHFLFDLYSILFYHIVMNRLWMNYEFFVNFFEWWIGDRGGWEEIFVDKFVENVDKFEEGEDDWLRWRWLGMMG